MLHENRARSRIMKVDTSSGLKHTKETFTIKLHLLTNINVYCYQSAHSTDQGRFHPIGPHGKVCKHLYRIFQRIASARRQTTKPANHASDLSALMRNVKKGSSPPGSKSFLGSSHCPLLPPFWSTSSIQAAPNLHPRTLLLLCSRGQAANQKPERASGKC